jgi:hypothetical protein
MEEQYEYAVRGEPDTRGISAEVIAPARDLAAAMVDANRFRTANYRNVRIVRRAREGAWDNLTAMRRAWAMPSAKTFSIPPIDALIKSYTAGMEVIVDPFARDSKHATITNDLNPDTEADYHMEAAEFCAMLAEQGVTADAVLFDPPYSPRQMAEVYQKVGIRGMESTQNARLYKAVRDGLDAILRPGGVAISFGWNSAGFGKKRGYEPIEILLVAHGGAHNDTICVVERKSGGGQ